MRSLWAMAILAAFLVHGAPLWAQLWVGSPEEQKGAVVALEERFWNHITGAPESMDAQTSVFLWGPTLAALPAPVRSADDWQRLADSTRGNGWTQRAVLWRLHNELRRSGQLTAARKVPLTIGSPRRWLGVGPFGRTGPTSLHRSYPPEASFDADARYPVDGIDVFWRPISIAEGSTTISPGDEWRRQGGAYYLRSVFAIDDDFHGLLQTAGGASLRIWINGVEVAVIDHTYNQLPAVQRHGVRLGAGKHELLVKCDGTRFNLMFRDAQGSPLPLTDLPPETKLSRAERAEAAAAPDVTPIGLITHDWWQQWLRRELTDDRALALALVMLGEGRPIECRRILGRFEEEVGLTIPYALAVNRCYDSLDYLPGEWRENWCARAWDAALAKEPRLVPILLSQAAELYAEDRVDEAVERLDEVFAVQPDSLPGLLLREELCHHREWRNERLKTLTQLEALAPDHPAVLGRIIRRWDEVGRARRAQPLRERRFAVDPDAYNARALADSYRSLGDRDRALELAHQIDEIDGGSTDSLLTQYELFQDLGANDEALKVVEALIERIPDDDRNHNARARFLWERGDLPGALEAYQQALALTPGQAAILERISYLERQINDTPKPAPFWAPYDRSYQEITAEPPSVSAYPGAASVLLFDLMVSRVGPRGGIEEYVHQTIRIDSTQAIEEYSEFTVVGELLALRVFTPDGEELHPTSGDGGGGYTLPGLTPGAIIDYATIMRRNVGRPEDLELGPFYFQDPNLSAAFHFTQWVVLLPDGWEPTIREENLPFERRERDLDGYREYVWEASGMDRPTPEPLAPPVDEIVPNAWMHGTLEWAPVLEEMVRSSAGADFVTPELEAAVTSILGKPDERPTRAEQVRRLHAATCERVTNEIGGSNATEIWMTRGGDRDILLAGLLRAAGIPFLEIRIAENDAIEPFRDWSIPSSEYFSYTLLEVPIADNSTGASTDPLILSTRFRLGAADAYPSNYHGGRAVRLLPAGAEWATLPPPPTPKAEIEMQTHVQLASGRTATVEGSMIQRDIASTLKERVIDLPSAQKQVAAEQFVAQLLPGAELESGDFPRLEVAGEPFQVAFRATTEQLLQEAADGYAIPTVHIPSSLRSQFGGKPERQHPMVSPISTTIVERSTIELGDYPLVSVPDNLTLSGRWGSYQLQYNQVQGTIQMTRRLQLRPCILPPDEARTFMEACRQIDKSEAERIRVGRP